MVNHPSGLETESEVIASSAEFWREIAPELEDTDMSDILQHLLTFQQGWVACKEFYSINV